MGRVVASALGSLIMAILRTGSSLLLTVPDLPLFEREQARQAIDGIARDHVELAIMLLAGYVSENAPRNFGTLAQSFQASPSTSAGGINVMGSAMADGSVILGRSFSSLPQAVVMEEGRRPGFGISLAGMASLGLWVRRKLGLTGRDAARATYFIARKIRRSGIPGLHYAAKGMHQAEPRIVALFDQMGRAIASGLLGGRR